MLEPKRGIGAFGANIALRTLIGVPMLLPYRWRVPLVGWLAAHVLAPLAGYRRRIRANLSFACPELTEDEIRKVSIEVADNAGRVLAELYSPKDRIARHATLPLTGPGVAAVEQAKAEGRPIIAVSGHFGNYDVLRLAFHTRGYNVGGLYRPMRNAYFNAHYVRRLKILAEPLFEQGRRGLGQMIKHLRGGGMIALLTDQRDLKGGAPLTFFGKTAYTPLSAAELALKHDALIFCCYGIRQQNGLDFDLVIEEPIPHSDPETMMQAVNDSLEAQVRAHMGQWLWAHNRWNLYGRGHKDNPTAQ